MRPPKKRIIWEYERIVRNLADKEVLISGGKRIPKDEFISVHDPALWDYMRSVYSYENNCSVKIYKCDDATIEKIKNKIKDEDAIKQYIERPKKFLDDEELGKYYLAKIDDFDALDYVRVWYVTFKKARYPYGFDQYKDYIATVKSNVFIAGNYLIVRGQSVMLPGVSDKFMLDFDIGEDGIEELTGYDDMLGLFDKLKKDGRVDLKTKEKTVENPIGGVPADRITFSSPNEEDGDIDDFDQKDEIAQMIDDASEVSKVLEYCFIEDTGYKEYANIAIGKGSNSIRIAGKISDVAIIKLSKSVGDKIIELQSNEDNSAGSVADIEQEGDNR